MDTSKGLTAGQCANHLPVPPSLTISPPLSRFPRSLTGARWRIHEGRRFENDVDASANVNAYNDENGNRINKPEQNDDKQEG